MTTLILKKTASIYGIGGGNDYTVLTALASSDAIFLSPAAPPDRNWMWTIIAREYPPSIHNRGYSPTREQAMVDFKTVVSELKGLNKYLLFQCLLPY